MIQFGIIGCGHIGQRHAEHIVANQSAKLVGVFDIVEQKTESLSTATNSIAFHSVMDLLAHKDIDIVCICTPNGSHHTEAIRALKAGKHVLVEKPMSIRSEWCKQMIDAAKEVNKELFVVKQNRFNPPVSIVKDLMDQNQLGKIYSVVTNCYWNRNDAYYQQSNWRGTIQHDGGTLFTQFSHFIDILYYLFGSFESISGVTQNVSHQKTIEFEDTGFFLLQFNEHNCYGSFNYTTSSYEQNLEGSITIFAENGTLKIGGKYLNTLEYQKIKDCDIIEIPQGKPGNNYGFYEGSMSNHDKVIHNVVQTLKNNETIMTNAENGKKVVSIIEQFYETARRSK